jgi:hypothetical protein
MEEDTVVRLPRPGASVETDPLLELLRSGALQMPWAGWSCAIEG